MIKDLLKRSRLRMIPTSGFFSLIPKAVYSCVVSQVFISADLESQGRQGPLKPLIDLFKYKSDACLGAKPHMHVPKNS